MRGTLIVVFRRTFLRPYRPWSLTEHAVMVGLVLGALLSVYLFVGQSWVR